jgi:acetyl esterase
VWAVPSALDPDTVRGSTAVAGRPEQEEAVMPNPVDLEPQAKAVVDANANPPYLFELGAAQGRRTIDAVQSGPVKKLTVDIEDTTVPGGPSGQVPVRILRPQAPAGRCR